MKIASPGFIIFILLCHCYTSSSNAYKNGLKDAGSQVDLWEVARQNRITQQILQSFLEKKLFPTLKRPLYTRPPSVWEILPKSRNPPPNKNIQDLLNSTDSIPGETLQVVESEQVSSIYGSDDDDLEGMCIF